jgi:hypothetical protein
LAEPKRIAAQVLTTSPMKVRTLGFIRESASQRTMVSSRTPQARPKAEVQLRLALERSPGEMLGAIAGAVAGFGDLAAEGPVVATLSEGSGEADISLPPFLVRLRRGSW